MSQNTNNSPNDYGTLPLIGGDVYSVEENLLKLAARYFFNGEQVDMSTLRPSIFGFFSQGSALVLKNGVFHRNSLYDEFFLNSASYDSSIYNFAKEQNEVISLATPAKIILTIGIKESDLIAGADYINGDKNTRVFKIDKFSQINLDKFAYLLPNSVYIQCKKLGQMAAGSNWQFVANYNLQDYHIASLAMRNPYIKLFRSSSNGENYVIMELTAYQMAYKETTTEIYESDVAAHLSWELQFSDHLAGFALLVRKPTETTYQLMQNAYFNASEAPADATEYYYYNYPSTSSLEIYFGSSPDYRPLYGSALRFRTYSSKGAAGNFSYNGPVYFRLYTSDEDIRLGYSDKSGIGVIAKNLSDSTGGKDRPSIVEIKKKLIRNKLTRNNLITETDLNIFFNDEIIKDVVNGGQITFFKHRDDILKRMFAAFALLRDAQKRVVPTNTVSFVVDYSRLEQMKLSLKPGTIIIYDAVSRTHRLLEEDEYPDAYLNDNRNFIYSLPYLLALKLSPFPRVIYYSVDTDTERAFHVSDNPSYVWEALVNNLRVQRGALYDQEYYLSLNLNTNITSFVTPLDEKTSALDYVKVRLLFRDSRTKQYLCAVDLSRERSSESTYGAYLHCKDEIQQDGTLAIYNLAGQQSLISMSGEDLPVVYLPEKFEISVCVLYDALGCEGPGLSDEISQKTLTQYPLFQKMVDLSGTLGNGRPYRYGIAGVFVHDTEEYYAFHRNMSNYMYSDAVINSNAAIVFNSVPVIGTKYYSDRNNNKEVNRVLRVYETLLQNNMSRLENNTAIAFKFCNSYGVSRYYQSDSTNLFIEMKIKLSAPRTNELDAKIRASIVSYVEAANEQNVVDFSSIVTLVRNSFPEILLINIVGINRLGIQAIEQLPGKSPESMDVEELRSYVPEYLNINMEENMGRLNYSIVLTYI